MTDPKDKKKKEKDTDFTIENMDTELDRQYKAIGKIVVAFNRLDVRVNSFIGLLICDNVAIGQILTSELKSFSSKWKLLFSVFKKKAASMVWFDIPLKESVFDERAILVEEMFKLKRRAIENVDNKVSINDMRNKIIHSYWFQQHRHIEKNGENAQLTGLDIRSEQKREIEGGKSTKKKGGKSGIKYDVLSMTSNELESFVGEINSFINDLKAFQEKIEKLQEKEGKIL